MDWPSHERPREKLLLKGAATLSDAELLAIFLRTGIKGKTAVDLARELLLEFGGLRELLAADKGRFCACSGLGEAKYVQTQAILEICKRFLEETLKRGDALSNPSQTKQFIIARMRDNKQEVFACLFLDNRHRVISFDEMFFGSINCASVYPREIVKKALRHNAAAVILAHNHPSGVAEPSQADRSLTEQLKRTLSIMDIRVLDHIVVGEGEPVSFAERGWI